MPLPSSITVGDTWEFRAESADYPASAGWAATLKLVPQSGAALVITASATADGDDYRFDIAAATTAGYAAGTYAAAVYVTLSGARHTIATGMVTIAANPAAMTAGTDTRSQAARALADLKTALAAWTPTKRAYTVGDVSMTFNSTADIVGLINFWERIVASENTAAALAVGRVNPNKIYVRAGRA